MANALDFMIRQDIKRTRNFRLCIRCNHMESACACCEPLWVSKETAKGKNITELRVILKFGSEKETP